MIRIIANPHISVDQFGIIKKKKSKLTLKSWTPDVRLTKNQNAELKDFTRFRSKRKLIKIQKT